MGSFTDMLGTAADSAGPSTPSVGATDSRGQRQSCLGSGQFPPSCTPWSLMGFYNKQKRPGPSQVRSQAKLFTIRPWPLITINLISLAPEGRLPPLPGDVRISCWALHPFPQAFFLPQRKALPPPPYSQSCFLCWFFFLHQASWTEAGPHSLPVSSFSDTGHLPSFLSLAKSKETYILKV